MKMTSQEEDLIISKENNLTGQGTYRKTTLQEVSHTWRQPQKKTTLQENILTGRQSPPEYGIEKGNNKKKNSQKRLGSTLVGLSGIAS